MEGREAMVAVEEAEDGAALGSDGEELAAPGRVEGGAPAGEVVGEVDQEGQPGEGGAAVDVCDKVAARVETRAGPGAVVVNLEDVGRRVLVEAPAAIEANARREAHAPKVYGLGQEVAGAVEDAIVALGVHDPHAVLVFPDVPPQRDRRVLGVAHRLARRDDRLALVRRQHVVEHENTQRLVDDLLRRRRPRAARGRSRRRRRRKDRQIPPLRSRLAPDDPVR
mmetsp:Transcript_20299/g.63780  ORF Transcript_20299/g.63780 Transcript_20299/m.63780 type:complete len:223 (-) Transcript_20299:272-940(-)